MPQQSDSQHRRSIRLRDFNYATNGVYFVTIYTQDKVCRFGTVVAGEMQLNALGEIVRDEWLRTAAVRPQVGLDAFVIMPNHLHGIIMIDQPRRAANGIIGRDNRTIQGCCHPPGQYQRSSLAAQLLRTCHPQRRRSRCYSRLHRCQSGPLG